MCYGENNAAHSATFINSQFKTHWDIASECLNNYDGFKPDVKQHRYSLALAEYHFGRHRQDAEGMDDLMFYAQFIAPSVIFLCNHQALVTITVREGHFNQDHLRASDATFADSARNVTIASQSFTFRVPFKAEGVAGRSTVIGTGDHVINLVVFDYRSAQIVNTEPEVVNGRQALEFYLHGYLKFLQSAGLHVFFSQSIFDDEPEAHKLLNDYSRDVQLKELELLKLMEVHGVTIAQINRYLSTMWLKAAMLVGAQSNKLIDRPAASIAEFSNMWGAHEDDVFFHLRFGTPEVAALCDDEVIVYFVVDEAYFYESEDFTQDPFKTFSDWRIAVVMDLIYERPEAEGGNLITCKVNVTTSRFLRNFSSFGELETSEDQEVLACLDYVVDFVRGEYLNVLESAGYHIIYQHDSRWQQIGTLEEIEMATEYDDAEWSRYEADESKLVSKTAAWRHIIQNSDIGVYDQITALSEASINGHFRSSATAGSTLSEWTFESYFNAKFEPPTIRLMADKGTAIIFIHLKSGTLRHLRNFQLHSDGEEFDFASWRVAFEVSLKMADHSYLASEDSEWLSSFAESAVAKEYEGKEVEFKHLYLNFDNVRFVHEFSRFEGLFTGQHKRSIEKVQAAVVYLRDYYLRELVKRGNHLLYTIPVWKSPSDIYPHGLTSVNFHVYTSRVSAEHASIEQSRASHSTILVVGTCGGKGMPPISLHYWSEWVAHSGRLSSYGTVGISNKLFLDHKLLGVLSRVNAATTIIPSFSGIERQQWILKLTGWSEHEERKHSACPFGLAQSNGNDDLLEYVWRCSDVWDYQHRHGHDHNAMSGNFSVASTTVNYLHIPTVFKPGTMEIKMRGEIGLKLNVVSDVRWSAQAHATWAVSLVVHSESSGLRVSVQQTPIQIKIDNVEGDTELPLAIKPDELLAEALPKTIDLEAAVALFVHFEKAWLSCYPGMSAYKLAHPVFNRRGDLLFELRPQSSAGSIVANGDSTSGPRIVAKAGAGRNFGINRRRGRANGATNGA